MTHMLQLLAVHHWAVVPVQMKEVCEWLFQQLCLHSVQRECSGVEVKLWHSTIVESAADLKQLLWCLVTR